MKKIHDTKKITIIGAGLAGTLLSVLLAKRGFQVDLFERNHDPRKSGPAAGRSINLALAERGRYALRLAGLLEEVDRFTIPMRGRMLHSIDGTLTLQKYGKDESEVIWSTHRAELNKTMLNAAEASDRVRIFFNHTVTAVDWETNTLHCINPEKEKSHSHQFEVLIGADGGGSPVRKAMGAVTDLGVSEDILEHGYRELSIPAGVSGEFQMDQNALHIWPRGGFMLIALPNSGGSFTVTLFLSNHENPGFGHLKDWPQQQQFIEQHFPDIKFLLGDLEADFRDNPVGLLGTVRCKKWYLNDKALLLGDAAHAIVPFHGQGMNAAFEDCSEFIDCLENQNRGWEEFFEDFQEKRIDHANAIADMALENYLIMRESVRDPNFLLRKELEHELERRHPQRFIARYSLVMFHRLPYALVYQRGQLQAGILDRLLADADVLKDVDFELAARLINEQLDKLG
ncbi:MAG: kynurenine 3-monooxygenase [Rhodothermales bacterium]|jgi:kynurenine 3-monooxygenase